jgi:hypothetical protein
MADVRAALQQRQQARASVKSMRQAGAAAALKWHKDEAAAAQRRVEEAASARVAALRSADMGSYLALLQQTKNSRLQQVLATTSDCLRQLAAKLHTATTTVTAAGAADGGSDGGKASAGVASTWEALAASLPADIQQQPALLTGGHLRGYQMHVRCREHRPSAPTMRNACHVVARHMHSMRSIMMHCLRPPCNLVQPGP